MATHPPIRFYEYQDSYGEAFSAASVATAAISAAERAESLARVAVEASDISIATSLAKDAGSVADDAESIGERAESLAREGTGDESAASVADRAESIGERAESLARTELGASEAAVDADSVAERSASLARIGGAASDAAIEAYSVADRAESIGRRGESTAERAESLGHDNAESILASPSPRTLFTGGGLPLLSIGERYNHYINNENGDLYRKDVNGTGDTWSLTQQDGYANLTTNVYGRSNCGFWNSAFGDRIGRIRTDNGFATGKRYFELYLNASPGTADSGLGIANGSWGVNNIPGDDANGYSIRSGTSPNRTEFWHNGSIVATDTANGRWLAGDTIGFAIDFDNHEMYIHKNGTWLGLCNPNGRVNPIFSGISAVTWYIAVQTQGLSLEGMALEIWSSPTELTYGGLVPDDYSQGWFTGGSIEWIYLMNTQSVALSEAIVSSESASEARSIALEAGGGVDPSEVVLNSESASFAKSLAIIVDSEVEVLDNEVATINARFYTYTKTDFAHPPTLPITADANGFYFIGLAASDNSEAYIKIRGIQRGDRFACKDIAGSAATYPIKVCSSIGVSIAGGTNVDISSDADSCCLWLSENWIGAELAYNGEGEWNVIDKKVL